MAGSKLHDGRRHATERKSDPRPGSHGSIHAATGIIVDDILTRVEAADECS